MEIKCFFSSTLDKLNTFIIENGIIPNQILSLQFVKRDMICMFYFNLTQIKNENPETNPLSPSS
jgi:hypothetical protein